ncbi:SRPBCC family protein [Microtetraspora niveoalba]|uniref:SRPBCC family protein n=1 Tax=Microtetraspora niveoalba TaxID=46175 RepID=UPI00082D3072|nr:SRPBCC family protein [Microtetraspora niveoalba]
MSSIEHSVNVNVPVRTAYNQWTQFESFPEFMEGVDSVKQVTDTRTYWAVEIGGVRRDFDAEITEQHPDERVAWRSLDRPHQSGVVTFHRLDDAHCRVTLQLEYDPEGLAETAADLLQIVRRRVKGDLERFKTYIESRGTETGGWRGDIPAPHQEGRSGGSGSGTGYDIGEPMPPQPVNPEYPPKSPLPAPGPGPVPPEGGPGTTLPRA